MTDCLLTPPVSPQRDRLRGVIDAPIVIVKYGDFACPQCRVAYAIVKKIQRRYSDRLCFVFRHFPQTELHPRAMRSAEAAEAAAVQGKFWQMHDFLYEHQRALEDGDLFEYAIRINLDTTRFLREMSAKVHLPRIIEDRENGIRSGVLNTPTFFINRVCYRGKVTFEELFAAVEESNRG